MSDLDNTENADVLILAGDLAEYPEGLDWLLKQACKYTYVFYVLGNHEFYRNEYYETIRQVKKFFNQTNVIVLDNSSFIHEDVVFIGSTFWTDFQGKNPVAMLNVQLGLNDYNYITYKTIPGLSDKQIKITPEFVLHQHEQARDYIFDTCDKYKDKKVVVITHHSPSMRAYDNSGFRGDKLNAGFASNYDAVITRHPNIKAWVYGHIHDTHTYKIGETNLYCNARGYARCGEDVKFNLNACFNV
jgi:Icc-related predicted phosphoesterase